MTLHFCLYKPGFVSDAEVSDFADDLHLEHMCRCKEVSGACEEGSDFRGRCFPVGESEPVQLGGKSHH